MIIYQVDAFADELFTGNPAAVCPLDNWLPENLMQRIAFENNLSETAFFVREDDTYHIRWFTPRIEVDLCGHATLATAHVLFNHMDVADKVIQFRSMSEMLYVKRSGDLITLDFPASGFQKADPPGDLVNGIGMIPLETYLSTDYLVLLDSEEEVREAIPDFNLLNKIESRGIIITAPGRSVDFVSRFFAPASGINEDPVTGSAHTILVPFWAEKTGKTEFIARQLSERGGTLYCKLAGKRVEISGRAITYLIGEITIS